jgi:hypothetical protein
MSAPAPASMTDAERRAQEFDEAGRVPDEPAPARSVRFSSRPLLPSWWQPMLTLTVPDSAHNFEWINERLTWAYRTHKRDMWLLRTILTTKIPRLTKETLPSSSSAQTLYNTWVADPKYTGLRARWDGVNNCLVSKTGSYVKPPSEWVECMPENVVLDGVLTHLGGIGNMRNVFRSGDKVDWSCLVFRAFDMPLLGANEPFALRKQLLLWLHANTRRKKECMESSPEGTVLFKCVQTHRMHWKGTSDEQLSKIDRHAAANFNPDVVAGVIFKRLDSMYNDATGWVKHMYWEDTVCRFLGMNKDGAVVEDGLGKYHAILEHRVPLNIRTLPAKTLVRVRYKGEWRSAHIVCVNVEEKAD